MESDKIQIMSIESNRSERKESFAIVEGPINGFSHANRAIRKSPSTFSYTLDAVNYNPEIEIPKSGELVLKPENILENMHFYLYAKFESRLKSFSFIYFHYQDIAGEFFGKKFEIGSESVMKDFASQPEFKNLYDEGSVSYDLDGQDYFFGMNKQTENIFFAVNGRLFAEISSKPSAESLNVRVFAPNSRLVR